MASDARPLSFAGSFLRRGSRLLFEIDGRPLASWTAAQEYLRQRLAEQGLRPLRSYLGLPEATPDAIRRQLSAAGWPLRHATRAKARSAAARFEGDLPAQLAAQAADPEPPAAVAPPSDCVRYGSLERASEETLRRGIEGRGGAVYYIAPARCEIDAPGPPWAETMTEMAYQLAGVRRYAYILFAFSGDDWTMSYITVSQRLLAGAAAAALDEARRRPPLP
jgi:hypothetical protein